MASYVTIAFLSNTGHIYWYNAINNINPSKQLKRALESKLSNFKIFKTASIFVSLTDQVLETRINHTSALVHFV